MTTIAVTNRKGGVGKTTHALHLAAGLAAAGFNTALVDTDSQGHIAVSLDVPRTDALYDVLVEKVALEDKMFLVDPARYSPPEFPAKASLYVLPAYNKTYRIPHELGEFGTFAFLNMVDEIKRQYRVHFVIIDTSPTLKDFDGSIYLATDAFLYVTEAESLALDGLDNAIAQMMGIARDRKSHLKRETTILGILPNKVRPNTDAHTIGIEELQDKYRELVWEPVTLRTVWAEASLTHQVLYTYAPAHRATREAWRVVERTVKAIEQWQRKTT
jgi:chromosome partitioning protein